MNTKAIRTPEGARAIIEYNIQVLYHLPKRYRYLDTALKDVRYDLLKILKFCKDNDPIIWKQKYVWFLDNKRLMALRKRMTWATSNKHFNYLCCLGSLSKLRQTANYMTGVNMTFLANEAKNGKTRPINTFTVYRYTSKKLDEMERRAEDLLRHKITPGNISNDKMIANGCTELAQEVFYANSETSIYNKMDLYQRILEHLEALCNDNGVTNKKELCRSLGWKRKKLDKILGIFKESWKQMYQYKAPNHQEMTEYNLTTKEWIIKRR